MDYQYTRGAEIDQNLQTRNEAGIFYTKLAHNEKTLNTN